VKTGRLLKFQRPRGEVQAYLYREAGQYHASMYLYSSGHDRRGELLPTISGPSETAVETAVRAWVDEHYPR
jgi:hypothetical protein